MTALAAQIANDHETFDGLESATFTSINDGSGADVDIASVSLLPQAQTETDLQALGGGVQQEVRVWQIPAVLLRHADVFHKYIPPWLSDWITLTSAAASPAFFCRVKPSDKITDAGGLVWIVGIVSLVTLGTRWRCVCVRQMA